MPSLRLETATPTETGKTIIELKKQLDEKGQEINEITQKVTDLMEIVKPYPDFLKSNDDSDFKASIQNRHMKTYSVKDGEEKEQQLADKKEDEKI